MMNPNNCRKTLNCETSSIDPVVIGLTLSDMFTFSNLNILLNIGAIAQSFVKLVVADTQGTLVK